MFRWLWVGVFVLSWVGGIRAQTAVWDSSASGRAQAETAQAEPPPSPTGALLRSAALPGWGQFYNKKRLKGTVFIVMEAGLLTGVLLQRDASQPGGLTPLGSSMLLGLIGAHAYGMIDAYIDAHFADFDRPEPLGMARPAISAGIRIRW